MKKYAFVEYGGQVLSIETRCSGFKNQRFRQENWQSKILFIPIW